jgi:hypothetical protein
MAALMYGEVRHFVQGLDQLSSIVGGAVRESAHHENGRYVHFERECASASFERAGVSILVRGDGDSLRPLVELAEVLSERLATTGLEHRLGVYEGEQLATYLHFRWPQASS